MKQQQLYRTHHMNGFAITYGRLKERVTAIQVAKGISRQQVMNFASAVYGWMRRLSLTDTMLIGVEMTSNFARANRQHLSEPVTAASPAQVRTSGRIELTTARPSSQLHSLAA